jgi:hypothetical protein
MLHKHARDCNTELQQFAHRVIPEYQLSQLDDTTYREFAPALGGRRVVWSECHSALFIAEIAIHSIQHPCSPQSTDNPVFEDGFYRLLFDELLGAALMYAFNSAARLAITFCWFPESLMSAFH